MSEFEVTHVLSMKQYGEFRGLSTMEQAYATACLFTEEERLKDDLNVAELNLCFSPAAFAKIKEVCAEFSKSAASILDPIRHKHGTFAVDKRAGRDLWHTSNNHGCGFWDGEEMWGDDGDTLSALAMVAGEKALYVGDDGLMYLTP